MTNRSVTLEDVLAWIAGERTGDEASAIMRAVERDPALAAHARLARAVGEATAAGPLPDVSPEVIRAAQSIFRAPAKPSIIDRATAAIAELLFDSRLAPALVRDRTISGYQLGYRAGATDIDLEIQKPAAGSGGAHRLVGQIVPETQAVADVDLIDASTGRVVHSLRTGSDGHFEVQCAPGRYRLRVELLSTEREPSLLEVQELDVG